MEQHLFARQLQRSQCVLEETSYLQMELYNDNDCNMVDQCPLPMDEFHNFIDGFETVSQPWALYEVQFRNLPQIGPRNSAGLENYIQVPRSQPNLQVNAKHPDTFRPDCISLPQPQYEKMIKSMNLPIKALGTNACVGPLFWWDLNETNGKKRLEIIFRKADIKKQGSTRGWELFLSHDIEENTTTGFYKGTDTSSITDVLSVLKSCADDTYHPLLLPLIIFEVECMSHTELKQRDVRARVRIIERQLEQKLQNPAKDGNHMAELHTELLRREMVECHAQALWKAPKDYIRILQSFRACLGKMESTIHEASSNADGLANTRRRFAARFNLLEKRFETQITYVDTTLMRLSMQQDALDNLIARQENRLAVKLAGEQRALAYASKSDSTTMKALSLLGAIFLPGAYVASIMSTTFFDFHDSATLSSAVSPRFWLYWAIVVPLTACVIAAWYLWESQKRKKTHEVAEALKQQGVNVDQMEAEVLAAMKERRRASVEERYFYQ